MQQSSFPEQLDNFVEFTSKVLKLVARNNAVNHIEDINDEMDLDEDPAMTYNKLVLLADETTVSRVEIVSNQLNNSEEEVLYEISEEGPNDNTKDPSLIEENIKIKQLS
ncbi:hypothetical protein MFLAVUS_007009 [Mucor flavus]|uniref:Uncharacterized protein n=1 Tax=Mucor flavus TaxID=439312 RepID=A0ABP9Z352_9FUNG